MKTLHLSAQLRFPLDAATQTLLIVGKRGSGKSSTATRFAEQLIDARVPVAVLDPVDVWWGLKAGADGQREGGKEVYIFGGRHADLPLEPTAGELMADVLVDHRINAVMVLREFSNRDKARFAAAFADRLFQRNTEVLQLIVEEAHELMPQQPFKGEEEMLGRMLRLQKLGRSSGIGMTSVTQRAASLNKNATTQAEVLIAHRLIGPQDIRAVEEWIKHHHQEGLKQQVLSTLPELKTGEAWIWAPDFPEDRPIGLQRARILMPETFDSRRTPKPGEQRTEPKQLAPVDLDRLRSKMEAAVQRAKQQDPRELHREVARLKAELARKPQTVTAAPAVKEIRVDVPVLKDGQLTRLEQVVGRWLKGIDLLVDVGQQLGTSAHDMQTALAKVRNGTQAPAPPKPAALAAHQGPVRLLAPRPVPSPPRDRDGDEAALTLGERRVLAAAAQYPAGTTRPQLTVLTGYKRSTRDTYLQRLGAKGHIVVRDGRVRVTDDGASALGDADPLPTGAELRAYWLQRLPEGERRLLEVLIAAYPDAIERERLSESTEYARSSRDTYLQRLSAKQLVLTTGRGIVRASEDLF